MDYDAIIDAAIELALLCQRGKSGNATDADLEAAWGRLLALRWQSMDSAPRGDELVPTILYNGDEVTVGAVWESGWADWLHNWMDPEPTAWMPLPPAPVKD